MDTVPTTHCKAQTSFPGTLTPTDNSATPINFRARTETWTPVPEVNRQHAPLLRSDHPKWKKGTHHIWCHWSQNLSEDLWMLSAPPWYSNNQNACPTPAACLALLDRDGCGCVNSLITPVIRQFHSVSADPLSATALPGPPFVFRDNGLYQSQSYIYIKNKNLRQGSTRILTYCRKKKALEMLMRYTTVNHTIFPGWFSSLPINNVKDNLPEANDLLLYCPLYPQSCCTMEMAGPPNYTGMYRGPKTREEI